MWTRSGIGVSLSDTLKVSPAATATPFDWEEPTAVEEVSDVPVDCASLPPAVVLPPCPEAAEWVADPWADWLRPVTVPLSSFDSVLPAPVVTASPVVAFHVLPSDQFFCCVC